jgi:glycosyltransferase involved in cell wall biosynthesis
MRIAYDYQIFQNQRFGGISRYYAALAKSLASMGESVQVFAPFHSNEYLSKTSSALISGFYLNRQRRQSRRSRRLFEVLNHYAGQAAMAAWRPDLCHETYYQNVRTSPKGTPVVVTVYDMIHELFSDMMAGDSATIEKKRAAIFRADQIICISESTRYDLLRLYDLDPKRVAVTHLGFDSAILPQSHLETSHGKGGRPYLLYVGMRGAYKNFHGLLSAVASSPLLKREFDVLAFGGGPLKTKESEAIRALGLEGRVRQTDGSDEALAIAYRNATAFIYPSLYEGFGLPPLEAMYHSCPVVASNTSSMPEVIGEAGALVDPTNHEAMAAAIERVVTDATWRDCLVALGHERVKCFTWNACAEETSQVYRNLLA